MMIEVLAMIISMMCITMMMVMMPHIPQ